MSLKCEFEWLPELERRRAELAKELLESPSREVTALLYSAERLLEGVKWLENRLGKALPLHWLLCVYCHERRKRLEEKWQYFDRWYGERLEGRKDEAA